MNVRLTRRPGHDRRQARSARNSSSPMMTVTGEAEQTRQAPPQHSGRPGCRLARELVMASRYGGCPGARSAAAVSWPARSFRACRSSSGRRMVKGHSREASRWAMPSRRSALCVHHDTGGVCGEGHGGAWQPAGDVVQRAVDEDLDVPAVRHPGQSRRQVSDGVEAVRGGEGPACGPRLTRCGRCGRSAGCRAGGRGRRRTSGRDGRRRHRDRGPVRSGPGARTGS